MKVKPKQRGSHTNLLIKESFFHLIPHNIEKIWTSSLIKIWGQLRPCTQEQHKESHNQRITIKAVRLLHGYFNGSHTTDNMIYKICDL